MIIINNTGGSMTFAISDLILIGLFIFFYLYWSSSHDVKQIAYNAVKAYCLKMDVQLLDDYVALNGFWLKRNEHGKIQVWRSYVFEFTSQGDDRYNGKVIMLGRKIEAIQLEPYRI